MKILFESIVWAEIQTIIQWSKTKKNEASFLGTGQIVSGNIVIDKIFIPKQEVSTASADLSEEGLAELFESLPKEDRNRILFWGHTHPGSTTPSGTDIATLKELKANNNIYIMAIFAAGATTYAKVFVRTQGLELEFTPEIDCIYSTRITNLIKENITEKKYAHTVGTGFYQNGNFNHQYEKGYMPYSTEYTPTVNQSYIKPSAHANAKVINPFENYTNKRKAKATRG